MHLDDDLGLLLVEGIQPGVGFDYGAVVRWEDATWEDQLARFRQRARDAGTVSSLLLSEGLTRPRDLADRLAVTGWTRLSGETVLWTRRPAGVPHLDPMLRLEAVTDRTAAEHEALERRIFGLPSAGREARVRGMAAGLSSGALRAYLVRSHGDAVASARLSMADEVAGLYAVGVAPERRRQGLGTLVTTIATRAGLASGRSLVWLSVENGNDAARRLYEGLGFLPAFDWWRWLGPPG